VEAARTDCSQRGREAVTGTRFARLFIALSAIAFLATLVGVANAHFNLNLNVRVFQVEHTPDGLRIYMRVPMPYLVASERGPIGDDGLPEAPPFTTNPMKNKG